MTSASVAYYIGGFESIGGIESCFFDLLQSLNGTGNNGKIFVWSKDLPQLRDLAAGGTKVHRSPFRFGCRWALPDWLLFLGHGRHLKSVDRIVFGKIPPEPVFRNMLSFLDRSKGRRPELLYITPYRPSDMWKGRIPDYISRAIDTMIVQSSDFAQDLRALGYGGRIVEIPYLPPLAVSAPSPTTLKSARCRLGFLGRFVPQKNLLYLLDMIEELRADSIEWHFFGEGELESEIRASAAERDLPVVFHGPVERSAVPDAIDSCDIFVNPSVSEGQCLVALEVLSRGRPFLASAVGAIPQILSRGRLGAIVPLNDAAAAAQVVRTVVQEWRDGRWEPDDVAKAYRAAYDGEAIALQYANLLTGPRWMKEET